LPALDYRRARLQNEVCRQFALGDVPATIQVENLSAAMALVSLDSPLRAMSLDIDRPINRAVVVGCAISATRNYLILHMSRTLKVLLCNTHAAEVVEAFCGVAASRSDTR
jgi:hypothetical protein